MSREWKPGDVAMVTYRTLGGEQEARCFRRGAWWHPADQKIATLGSALGEVVSARPLVVIDPEDREQVERLAEVYTDRRVNPNVCAAASMVADRLQAALRELATPTPPRPEEPQGLGAVVEAACSCEDDYRQRFVRDPAIRNFTMRGSGEKVPWTAQCGHHSWDVLSDVRVLSEGWSA